MNVNKLYEEFLKLNEIDKHTLDVLITTHLDKIKKDRFKRLRKEWLKIKDRSIKYHDDY